MPTCDLCNAPAGANSKRIANSQFRSAVRAGLRPDDSMFMMGAAFGLSKEQSSAGWVQQVMSDTTDWVLCEDCARRASPYGV
jgi:hypothetical protein